MQKKQPKKLSSYFLVVQVVLEAGVWCPNQVNQVLSPRSVAAARVSLASAYLCFKRVREGKKVLQDGLCKCRNALRMIETMTGNILFLLGMGLTPHCPLRPGKSGEIWMFHSSSWGRLLICRNCNVSLTVHAYRDSREFCRVSISPREMARIYSMPTATPVASLIIPG